MKTQLSLLIVLFILAIILPLFFDFVCFAEGNNTLAKKISSSGKLQSEKPLPGAIQATKLYGKVDILNSTCADVGIKLSSKMLPATVESVQLGSLAYHANIAKDDKVLSAEIKNDKFCLSIERNGQKYNAEINLIPASAAISKNSGLLGTVQKKHLPFSGRSSVGVFPKVIVNVYYVSGPGLQDIDMKAVFANGENTMTVRPNGEHPTIGGPGIYSAHYEMLDGKDCFYKVSTRGLHGSVRGFNLESLASCRGLVPEEDVERFFRFRTAHLTVDLVVINIGNLQEGGGNGNCRFNITVQGYQPKQSCYKSVIVYNTFQYVCGSSRDSSFEIDTRGCSQPIIGAVNTDIYNRTRYNFGYLNRKCICDIDGQISSGSGTPVYSLSQTDKVPPELVTFVDGIRHYTFRQLPGHGNW